jgi:hypothetical protein
MVGLENKMTKLETLESFFAAWSARAAMPVKKGRPGPEYVAADELVRMRAVAVTNWRGDAPVVAPSQLTQDFRSLQQQVAAIAPKDTRQHGKNG